MIATQFRYAQNPHPHHRMKFRSNLTAFPSLVGFLDLAALPPPAHSQNLPATRVLKPASHETGAEGWWSMVSRGYTPLFNGKDLTGWRNPYPHGEAKVVDGEIHLLADKKFFLITEKRYSDFRVSVEIHLPKGPANSGVMFRCHVDEDAQKKVYGYQAESKAAFADPASALNRNGWNRYEVTCVQDLIRIEVNGVETVRFRDATDASGFIGIQHHGEKGQTYRFRNLFIKELPEGMTAKLELPAGADTSGVFADGKPLTATRNADRWIVTDDVTSTVHLEVK